VRRSGDGADFLALEIFRANLRHDRVAPRHEPRRRPVIGIVKSTRPHLRRHRQRGDDGVAAVARDRIEQRLDRRIWMVQVTLISSQSIRARSTLKPAGLPSGR